MLLSTLWTEGPLKEFMARIPYCDSNRLLLYGPNCMVHLVHKLSRWPEYHRARRESTPGFVLANDDCCQLQQPILPGSSKQRPTAYVSIGKNPLCSVKTSPISNANPKTHSLTSLWNTCSRSLTLTCPLKWWLPNLLVYSLFDVFQSFGTSTSGG